MPEVTTIIDSVARVLGWAAVPVLAIAVGVSFMRHDRAPLTWRSWLVPIGASAFVVAVAAAGVVAGQRAGLLWEVPWTSVVAIVLVGLLLRRDERFWAGLPVLVVAYGLVGWVSILGFSHNYAADSGGWRGVRLLVAWAGPEANPQAPNFEFAVAHLSILLYGIPLAMTVAIAWVLATRRGMSRLEQVSLVLLTGAFFAEVIVGSTLSAVTFAAGVVAGLPLGLSLAGLLASLVMLITVAPGAVTGIVVGVRRLVTTRDVRTAHGLATTLRDAGGAHALGAPETVGSVEAAPTSLAGFVRGNVTLVRRFNIVVIVLAVVVVGGLTFTYRAFLGDPNQAEIAYQFVDKEQPVEGRVRREIDGSAQSMWLLTRDQRLLHFDPATERLTSVDLPVLDAFPLGDRVVALTAEATPRVVLVGGLVGDTPVTMTPVLSLVRGSNPTLAVVGNTAFVAERGGRLVAVSSKGVVVRQTTAGPLTAVLAEPAAANRPAVLWTLQPPTADDAGEGATYRAVHRDPATLAVLGQEAVTGTAVLRWASGLTYDPGSAAFSPRPKDAPARWVAGPQGRLDLAAAGTRVRYDFHYDAVIGVRETSGGTWLVVDDQAGVALTPRSVPASYLVRWPGAPKPVSTPATAPAAKPAKKG
ncbi:MAG: hypothetical protein ABI112_18820 [Terracoccus sp.]